MGKENSAQKNPVKPKALQNAEVVAARKDAAAARRELARERARALAEAPHKKLQGFVEFIREKGVVGLAIGLAIGTAATGLVNQIVNAVISPTIGLLIGEQGMATLNTTITIGARSEEFLFGDLLDAMVKFVAIAAVIYFVVLGLRLDKLDKKKV